MLFAILNAGLIYGVIWLFERKRRAKLSVSRANAYTAIVLVVNLALDLLLASRPR